MTDTWPRLQRIMHELVGAPTRALRRDASLRGTLLLDNLDFIDLATLIRGEFGIDRTPTAWQSLRSLDGICAFIDRETGAPGPGAESAPRRVAGGPTPLLSRSTEAD